MTWTDIIPEALRHHGGEASVQMVFQYVEDHDLTEHGRSGERSHGKPDYRRSIRGILSRMGKRGIIVNVRSGVWRVL